MVAPSFWRHDCGGKLFDFLEGKSISVNSLNQPRIDDTSVDGYEVKVTANKLSSPQAIFGRPFTQTGMKLFSSWQELPFQSRSSTTCGPCLAERILSAKTWILFDHSNVPALSIGISNWFGSCEVSRSSFSDAFLQGRSSCSHSASIFFSMDSFQTSPERGVQNKTHLPRWRLRCLWWWLTSKQSLKVVQGPRDSNRFYRCTLLFKTWQWRKAAWFLERKSLCNFSHAYK